MDKFFFVNTVIPTPSQLWIVFCENLSKTCPTSAIKGNEEFLTETMNTMKWISEKHRQKNYNAFFYSLFTFFPKLDKKDNCKNYRVYSW